MEETEFSSIGLLASVYSFIPLLLMANSKIKRRPSLGPSFDFVLLSEKLILPLLAEVSSQEEEPHRMDDVADAIDARHGL